MAGVRGSDDGEIFLRVFSVKAAKHAGDRTIEVNGGGECLNEGGDLVLRLFIVFSSAKNQYRIHGLSVAIG